MTGPAPSARRGSVAVVGRRCLRAHRRLPALPQPRRHPVRGRPPSRRPRPHPRRHRRRRARARGRQRVHRPQRPHLPPAAAALRRARSAGAPDRDEHEHPLRGLRARVRRRPRAQGAPRPAAPAARSRASCACCCRSGGSTAALGLPQQHRRQRPDDVRRVPARRGLRRALRHALRGPGRLLRLVLRPGHRAALPGPLPLPVPRPPRHAAASPGRRSGTPSSAARAPTSSASAPCSRPSAAGSPVTACPAHRRRRRDRATPAGRVSRFDRVVIATHADQALALLADPTDAEVATLKAFGVLAERDGPAHRRPLLPRATRARASWNYRMASCDEPGRRHRS